MEASDRRRLVPLLERMLNEERFAGLRWTDRSTKTFRLCWRDGQRSKPGDENTEIINYIGSILWPDKPIAKWKENLRNCLGTMVNTFENLTTEESKRDGFRIYRIKERQTISCPRSKSPRAVGRRGVDLPTNSREVGIDATQMQQNSITCHTAKNEVGAFRSRSPVNVESQTDPDIRYRVGLSRSSTMPADITSGARKASLTVAQKSKSVTSGGALMPGSCMNVPKLDWLKNAESSPNTGERSYVTPTPAQISPGFLQHFPTTPSEPPLTEITPTIPMTSEANITNQLPVSVSNPISTEHLSEMSLSSYTDNQNNESAAESYSDLTIPQPSPQLDITPIAIPQMSQTETTLKVITNPKTPTAMSEFVSGSYNRMHAVTSKTSIRSNTTEASNSGPGIPRRDPNIRELPSSALTTSRAQTGSSAHGAAAEDSHCLRLDVFYRYKQVLDMTREMKDISFTLYPGQSWYSSPGEQLGEKIKLPDLYSSVRNEFTKEQLESLNSIWDQMLKGVTISKKGFDVYVIRRCKARIISKIFNEPDSYKKLERGEKTHILNLRQYMLQTTSDSSINGLDTSSPQHQQTSVKVRLSFGLKDPVDDLRHGAIDVEMTFLPNADSINVDEHSLTNSFDKIIQNLESVSLPSQSK